MFRKLLCALGLHKWSRIYETEFCYDYQFCEAKGCFAVKMNERKGNLNDGK